jgi:putative MATE family efflux protein
MNALARNFSASSLIRFALPNIFMMMFLSFYTIADGIFVSRYVSTTALAVLNLVYPVACLEMAIGIMLAAGGSAVIASKLGEGKVDEARRNFTFLVAVEIALGILFLLVGVFFTEPVLFVLGVTPDLMPIGAAYQRILLYAAPLFFLQTSFQILFVTAGMPALGLASTVAGGVLNIALDWLFLGVFGFGVEGAAVATAIGYAAPALTGLAYFGLWRKGTLRFVRFAPDWRMLGRAAVNGSSEMVTNLANAVITYLFNLQFMRFLGEDGVAAISIVLYFEFLFTAVFFGYSQGVAPVTSYKLGAGDTPQLKKTTRINLVTVAALCVVAFLVSRLTDGFVAEIFTPEGSAVYDIVIEGMPLYSWAFLLMGFNIYASNLFTALGNGLVSGLISFLRTFVFMVGALIMLPELAGVPGIWLAVFAADALSALVSLAFILGLRHRYGY